MSLISGAAFDLEAVLLGCFIIAAVTGRTCRRGASFTTDEAGLLRANARGPLEETERGGLPPAPRADAAAQGPGSRSLSLFFFAPQRERSLAPACRSSNAGRFSFLCSLHSAGLSGVVVVPLSPLRGQAPDWTQKGPPGMCRPARPPLAARLSVEGRPEPVLAALARTPRPRDDACPWVGVGESGHDGRWRVQPGVVLHKL